MAGKFLIQRFAILLVAIGLAACGATENVVGTPAAGSQSVGRARSEVRLYVAETSGVYVYAPGSPKLLKSLRIRAGELTADATGDLYAVSLTALIHHAPTSLAVYAPGGSPLLYGIGPVGLLVDWAVSDSGGLSVATYKSIASYGKPDQITEFAPGSKVPAYQIADAGYVRALAANRGNLYVATTANQSSGTGLIAVYRPGAATPFREITKGVSAPSQMFFDSHGNLYVSNYGSPSSVSVYASDASTPKYAIAGKNGCACPAAVRNGELYLANGGDYAPVGKIAVYAPGAKSSYRSISIGRSQVSLLAFDPAGNLYVCCAKNGIAVFRNAKDLWYTIPLRGNVFASAFVFAPE